MDHVCALLDRLSDRVPDRAALVGTDGTVRTFRQLRDAAAGVSARLDALGLAPTAHVLLLVPVGISLYEQLLGILWGGRTAVLADPSADLPRLDVALAGVGLDAFIGTRKAHLLRLRLRALRGLALYGCPDPLWPIARSVAPAGRGERRSPLGEEPALITFTTGTTGVPKAMGRSHAFLLAQHHVLAGHMGLQPDDVDLPTLPVFLLNSLAVGATCVLPDGDLRDVSAFEPARLTAQVRRHGVTTSSGSPAFFAPWARWLVANGQTLDGMRRLFVGGARVPEDVLKDMVVAFPGASVEVLYGSTEAEPMASIPASEALSLDGEGVCVGAVVPGVDVRLVDPETDDAVPDGTAGEIRVAGPNVNGGYYKNPQADAENKVRRDGRVWHCTGDVAWRDEQGRLWLVGRVSNAVGGRYPFPTEAAAERVSGVQRAALVEVAGQAVLAFVGDATPEDIREATGVTDVRRVGVIPVDPRHRAKVDRAALARLLTRGGE